MRDTTEKDVLTERSSVVNKGRAWCLSSVFGLWIVVVSLSSTREIKTIRKDENIYILTVSAPILGYADHQWSGKCL